MVGNVDLSITMQFDLLMARMMLNDMARQMPKPTDEEARRMIFASARVAEGEPNERDDGMQNGRYACDWRIDVTPASTKRRASLDATEPRRNRRSSVGRPEQMPGMNPAAHHRRCLC